MAFLDSELKPTRSDQGYFTQTLVRPNRCSSQREQGSSQYIPGISIETLRRSVGPFTNRAGPTVVQMLEPEFNASGSATQTTILRNTRLVPDGHLSAEGENERWKGDLSTARWTCVSPSEEFNHPVSRPLPDVQQGEHNSMGAESQNAPTSQRGSDGSIIFYHQASFYTDLSGDVATGGVENRSYDRLLVEPVGAITDSEASWPGNETEPFSSTHTKNLIEFGHAPGPVMHEVGPKGVSVVTLYLDTSLSQFGALDFEVSGLGGVVPSDHFFIVTRSYLSTPDVDVSSLAKITQYSRPYQSRICRALQDNYSHTRSNSALVLHGRPGLGIKRNIIDLQVHNLPPSCLPPPSYYGYDSSEGSDEADNGEHGTRQNGQRARW